MKIGFVLSVLLAFIAFTGSSTRGGELSSQLADRVEASSPDEMITVWIKVRGGETAEGLKRAADPAGLSAGERHSRAINRLKSSHRASQQDLQATLTALSRQGLAADVRGFWIANLMAATIAAEKLPEIAGRADVEQVIIAPRVESIQNDRLTQSTAQDAAADSIAAHLVYMKADQAWAAGYTGLGRLICTFDSGIDGDHPAFASRWKGLDGDWRSAWFDPVGQDSVPHQIAGSAKSQHGTAVLGALLGYDSTISYATGVATEAQWISAAVTDLPDQVSHTLLEAFEWAADPDGNPNTVADRPDVINHSWGFGRVDHDISCEDIFFDVLDNIEALGIVNIFSAGNDGETGGQTITNPANRALDSLDAFAVGATSATGGWASPSSVQVASFSSRGPSDCDGFSVKPNVVAPGASIITSWPGGSYISVQGTSFSAPLVSGLVALLRQKNPNLTPTEIKQAILTTAVKDNFVDPRDNDWGWGEVDCLAALNAVSAVNASPNVRVYDFNHAQVMPGDTITGTILLQNIGAAATNVSGTLSSTDGRFTVVDGAVTFGSIAEGDTVRSAETVRIAVDPAVLVSTIVTLPLDLTVSGSPVQLGLAAIVGPVPGRALATHDNGTIQFTVSNFGMYGLGPISLTPVQGAGFTVDSGDNYLWESGLIIAQDLSPDYKVVSGIHSQIYASDYDFKPASEGGLTIMTGEKAAQITTCAFTDGNASDPIGLRIVQESYAFDPPEDDYIILRYEVHNESGGQLDDIYFGLMTDWDVVNFQINAGGYEDGDQFAWMAYNAGNETTPVLQELRGIALLEGTLSSAFTDDDIYAAIPYFGGNGYLDLEKFGDLQQGTATKDTHRSARKNLYQLMAAGPISLATGGVDTVAFAIMAGDNLIVMGQTAQSARLQYLDLPTDVDEPGDPILPTEFTVRQNYPNPFNPSTTISFDLPLAGDYRVRIVNTLGRTVAELTGKSPAGSVDVVWDATGFASGVYMYEVTAGSFSASRKMLLLK